MVLASGLDISVLQFSESTLGPILFLCFINDLHLATKLFTLLFAEATCALAADKSLNYLIDFCNTELKKIANWMVVNKLAVNVTKATTLFFITGPKTLQRKIKLFIFGTPWAKTTSRKRSFL